MTEHTQRLFFALWPDQPVREELMQRYDEMAAGLGFADRGRRVTRQNLHITLHYLGNTSESQKHCFVDQAHSVRFQPFQLKLDRLGFFRHAAVSWIAPSSLPTPLTNLHEHLARQLAHCDYIAESRAYRPHVTMARKLKPVLKTQHIAVIEWQVDGFVLVHSASTRHGVEYRVIERFER